MKIANAIACLVCLLSLGTTALASPNGRPPVLPEVTAADAAFHTDAVAPPAASVGAELASFTQPQKAAPSAGRPVLYGPSYGHHALVSLAVETPVGHTPDRAADNTPTVIGRLEVPKLVGPFGAFLGGTLQVKAGLPFSKENRAYFGIEAAVGQGLTAYTYAERRFDVNDNRFVAGCRWNMDLRF